MNKKNGVAGVQLTDELFKESEINDPTLRRAYLLKEIISGMMELNGASSAQADHMAVVAGVLFLSDHGPKNYPWNTSYIVNW